MASERSPLLSGAGGDYMAVDGLEAAAASPKAHGHHAEKNQLGTINGCYIPCLLNIMGIILFLRLGWAVGEAGVLVVLGILLIAELQSILTVLSLSALTSNGNMSTGGSYYLISRSLGPEFGGAMGTMFYAAYAVGVAFYVLGFANTVQTTFFSHVDNPEWVVRGIGSAGLFAMLIISLVGAGFFAKFNVLFFAVQFLAIIIGLVSFYIPHDYEGQVTVTKNTTFYHARADFPQHFQDNIHPSWDRSSSCQGKCDFHSIFGILFPMVTGIMEGANLSGDLKDPARSIPLGTLSAVGTSMFFYLLLIMAFAGAFRPEDLLQDQNIFQNATFGSKYIVVVGIIISSLSSALGSLFGGSRVLQAMARDNLSIVLKPFAFGSKRGDEPRVAVMCTWVIAQACVMIGDIDIVAPIISAFFCLSYAMCNLTCFLLSAMSAPNFRPKFKAYHWSTSLLGFLLNIAVMVFLAWEYALITLLVMFLIFVYLAAYGPVTDWGDVSNELIYHQVRKYLLRIDTSKKHTKYWKPNILLLVDGCHTGLLGFCNSLKKGGIFIVGQLVTGDFSTWQHVSDRLRDAWLAFIRTSRLKAFAQSVACPDPRLAAQMLTSCAGLGALTVNTVVIPFFEDDNASQSSESDVSDDAERAVRYEALETALLNKEVSLVDGRVRLPLSDASDYCGLIRDIIQMEKNVIVSRNFGKAISGRKGRLYTATSVQPNIDVWIVGDWALRPSRSRSASVSSAPLLPHEADGMSLPDVLSNDSAARSGRSLHTQDADYVPSEATPSEAGTDSSEDIVFEGVVSLLIQLGEILYLSRLGPGGKAKSRRSHSLRVFHVPSSRANGMAAHTAQEDYMKQLKSLCSRARLHTRADDLRVIMPADIVDASPDYARALDEYSTRNDVLPSLDDLDSTTRSKVINQLVNHYATQTCQVFMALPLPPSDNDSDACNRYLAGLRQMTEQLPPTSLVASGELTPFISTEI